MVEKQSTLVASKGTQTSNKLWDTCLLALDLQYIQEQNVKFACFLLNLQDGLCVVVQEYLENFSVSKVSFVAPGLLGSYRSKITLLLKQFPLKSRNGKFGLQHEKGPRKDSLDNSTFKLRWHRASDHRAFNNMENVWTNSCYGLPEQSDRKSNHNWRKRHGCEGFT